MATFGLAAASPSSSTLAAPADVDLFKTSKWVVDYGEGSCDLMRAGQDSPIALKITHELLGTSASITIGNTEWKKAPSSRAQLYDLIMLPQGDKGRISGVFRPAVKGSRLVLFGVDIRFFEALAQSSGLALESDGKRLVELSYKGAAAAVKQLHACDSALMRDWGIDEAALKALKQRAQPLVPLASVFKSDDYPEAALIAGVQGDVISRFDVGEDGKVTNCVAANKSANPALASAACRVLTTRARFQPAVGSDGKPVTSPVTTFSRWRIGEAVYSPAFHR